MSRSRNTVGLGVLPKLGLGLGGLRLGGLALALSLSLLTGCDDPKAGDAAAGADPSSSTAGAKNAKSAKPKKDASPFQPYAEGGDLRLAGTFGTTAALYVGGMLFPVDLDGAKQVDGVLRVGGPGNSSWSSIAQRVAGSWPKRAFAITSSSGADTINLWKPNEKRNSWFADVRGGSDRDPLLDASVYIEGGALAMQSLGNFDWKFWFAHPERAKVVTKPSPGSAPKGAKKCKVPLVPRRIQSFVSGEVFVLGIDCKSFEENKNALAVQRWTTASRQGPSEVLPAELGEAGKQDDLKNLAFEAFAPNSVYVGTNKGLAQFDGSAWKMAKAPSDKGVQALAQTQDKSLWALSGKKLFTQKAGGDAWKAIPLPEGSEPLALGSSAGALPWVLVKKGGKSTLLGPKGKAKVAKLPALAAVEKSDGMEPASSVCKTLFVPLRMNVAEGQGFDDVKKPIDAANKGVSYATVDYSKAKMFGAIPTDYAQGMAIVATAKKNDDKGVARLICRKAE